jgi:SHAQKYF class myb-like DNA-binding protein
MARNQHGYKRRAFKYDDEFEYTGNIGQKKGTIEMDPPGLGSQGKRKRKNTTLISVPFNEGMKRTMSEKTPSSHTALTTNDGKGVTYNQGRWTSLEHFKFLEALKKYGKEWQKVQQHVSTRTSTQARSHAQKFFVKLDKKSLTLDEFLKDLDLKEVEKTLLAAGNDNTDYDEEREVNMIANRKLRGSVMNIALPSDVEDKKRLDNISHLKRSRSEVDNYSGHHAQNDYNQGASSVKLSTKDRIRMAFEQHGREENGKSDGRSTKRMKTSERGDGEEKPCSELTAVTSGNKNNSGEPKESPFRKLSISNFEPIQPKGVAPKLKKPGLKDLVPTFGTPQPVRTDNTFKNEAFLTCFNKLVFNNNNSYHDDYHITPDQLFRRPMVTENQQSNAKAGQE